MTDCAELRPLVEKLHDLETTAAEKLAAEAHLEKCPGCRSHVAFLETLSEESRSMTYTEPPESYWEHLPRKVLNRIDSESSRPGFFDLLLSPPVLRWGGLGAALVVIGAVGLSIVREEPKALVPPPASAPVAATPPPPAFESPAPEEPVAVQAVPERQARLREAPPEPPPMARDETAESEPPPDSEQAELALDSAAPAESAAGFSSIEETAESVEKARRERSAALRANRAPAGESPTSLARGDAENCEAIRRAADTVREAPGSADIRYRLALCSLQKHEREATEELEALAVKDAEAFLALETEGTRADEIRALLRRIKPD